MTGSTRGSIWRATVSTSRGVHLMWIRLTQIWRKGQRKWQINYQYLIHIYIYVYINNYIFGKSWYVTRNPFKSSQRLAHGSCHTRLRIMLHFPHRVERIVVWLEVGLEDWPRHGGDRNTMRNRTERINPNINQINQILQLKIKNMVTFESRMV